MDYFNAIPFAGFLLLVILISGRVFFLKKNGIRVSAKKQKKSNLILLLYPVFVIMVLFFVMELLRPLNWFSFSVLPDLITHTLCDSIVLKIVGLILVLFSQVFLLLTLLHFKRSLRFGMTTDNLGSLITSGVFSISRNPFFLSLELYFLGVALLIPSLFFIGFTLLSIIAIHFFILREEKFMKANYGKDYKEYCKKAGRYF